MSSEELWRGTGPFTTAELAAACRCSQRYVQKLIEAGALEGRRLGRVWRVPATAAQRLARDLGVEPPAEVRDEVRDVRDIREVRDVRIARTGG